MEVLIVVIFVLGYLAITLEHSLKVDKLVPALLMMALAWAAVAFGLGDFTQWFDSGHHTMVDGFAALPDHVEGHATYSASKAGWLEHTLLHHFGKTCEI